MTEEILHDREAGFENKFKHDEELRFKVHAHAVELFGIWAAEQMKKPKDEVKEYADSLIDFDIDDPRSGDLERKVLKDFKVEGIDFAENALKGQLSLMISKSKKDLMEG